MLKYHLAVFKFLLTQSEDDIELYRNITSLHHRFLAFVACLIDTMQLLSLLVILYLLKLLAGNGFFTVWHIFPSATQCFK